MIPLGWSAIILLVERIRPFEPAWKPSDGQLMNDLAYSTILQYATYPLNAVFLVAIAWLIAGCQSLASLRVWPTDWPTIVVVPLGLIITDLGMHLAHRWMHKIPILWRFHVVHHSSGRFSVVNAGRAHPINNFLYVLIGAPVPILLGMPTEITLAYAAINLYVGSLSHANIDMRCGVFSYVINTPELHRWHHSRHQRETDTNFGEVFVIWDHLFGTYYNPHRRPHRDIGIDVDVSTNLIKQLIQPFTPAGHRHGQPTVPALSPGEAGLRWCED